MHRILFVCHGNICRSPMAEFVMKAIVREAGRERDYQIASAAVSDEEVGNPVYPPAMRELARHGIDCHGKTARRVTADDYANFDMIVCMDMSNRQRLLMIYGGDPDGKVRRLLDYTDRPRDVADPWYTRDFSAAWDDISWGCRCLFEQLDGKRSA